MFRWNTGKGRFLVLQVCGQRRRDGVVLRVSPCKPKSRVIAGVTPKNNTLSASRLQATII